MTFVWGAVLAAGVLLVISPWLWPRREQGPVIAAAGPIPRLLEDAGLAHVRPRVVVAIAGVCAIAAASMAWIVTGLGALAFVAAVAGASAPIALLRARRTRLRRRRRALWSDVCDLLIASVRAGRSLPVAVAELSTTAPPAIRGAFVAFDHDLAASGHFDSSVERLKTALADPIADRIVETLRMARQVGGTELTTVLRALADSVRADTALRAEVEARQSWIRGAAILGLIAPWAILGLLALRPEGARAYASPEGVVLILCGAAVSLLAFRVMLRIGRLPDPRRWFG
jgi:tight adherence protein B